MRTSSWHLIAALAVMISRVAYASPISPIAPGDIIFTELFNGWHKLDPATGQISEITSWNSSRGKSLSSLASTIAFDVDGSILFGSGSIILRLDPFTGETTWLRTVLGRSSPSGFVVEPNGDLILADHEQGISRFSRATQSVTNLIPASDTFTPRGITRTADGRIFATILDSIVELDLQAVTATPVTTSFSKFHDVIVNRPGGQLLIQSRAQPYGLFLVDPDTGNTQLFSDAFLPIGEGELAFDESGTLWQAGSRPGGIYRYPPSGGNPTFFPGGTFFNPRAIVVVPLDWTPPPIPEPNCLVLCTVATITTLANRRIFA